MKKVLTLDDYAFSAACRSLEEAVRAGGFAPDLVLGIESGGRYVAERMFAGVPHAYVAMRRPSTAGKEGVMRALVRHLPRCVNDVLRVLEARLLGLRRPVPRTYYGPLPDGLGSAGRVLVVDDAVDSGATMLAVCEAVVRAFPHVQLRSAAVTVTTPKPLIMPDFHIHNSLIRFPWSADARN